jgi:hypothetical protein
MNSYTKESRSQGIETTRVIAKQRKINSETYPLRYRTNMKEWKQAINK